MIDPDRTPSAATDETLPLDALREKLLDALTPGFAAELDPDEAVRAGAFREDALSENDAADSAIDREKDATPAEPRADVASAPAASLIGARAPAATQ